MNWTMTIMAAALATASAALPATAAMPQAAPATATGGACDRACLTGLGDRLLASMMAHAPDRVPLAHTYAATENSTPGALDMMGIWRTATAVKSKFFIVDPVSHQLFVIASIAEGPSETLLFGRIKAEGRQITEVELYENRSRAQGGFQFGPAGPANFPREWTVAAPPARRATRAQLLQAGRSVFDTRVPAPDASDTCVVMENGKVVSENPDVLAAISPPGAPKRPLNPDGSVSVPCGSPPERPTDANARVDIIDEDQGIVVSMAVVHGITAPYLATTPTESAFVPDAMYKPYGDMLAKQEAAGHNSAPRIRPMPATGMTAQVTRLYDGKMQGLQLLVNVGAAAAHSPWTAD